MGIFDLFRQKKKERPDYSDVTSYEKAIRKVQADELELIYLIPEEDAPQFAAKVTEMSAGSAGVSMKERVLYYGKEHPAIYAQLPVAD